MENLIPIPAGKQVRDHHSIPAAPRHNITNLDHQIKHMVKMPEGIPAMSESFNRSDPNSKKKRKHLKNEDYASG